MTKNLILIIDDQPENLQLAASLLSKDYKLILAENGLGGLEIARIKKPDLILLDVFMPDITGWEVCRRLKEDKDTKDIPVIFLSAATQEADIIEGFEAGGSDYILKPFRSKELRVRIRTHLSLRNAQAALQEKNYDLEMKTRDLEAANMLKVKFFSIIAHDLKSPFHGFLGLTKLIADNFETMTFEKTIELVEKLGESASSLYGLLENLLEWSRLQGGRMPFVPKTISLRDAVNTAFSIQKGRAEEKEIRFTPHVDHTFLVFADEQMLETILRNLISNALKFTARGGRIAVLAELSEDEMIRVTVKDTGVGMTETTIGKLFRLDEKVSTRGTENEPSTGLGLLLCKDLVEKNGGRIWAESVLALGSSFHFTVPANH